MKRIKAIAVMTALVMLITCIPLAASAASKPAKVKGVKAVQASAAQTVNVTWNKGKKVDGYKIYQKKNDGKYVLKATLKKGKKLKYSAKGLKAGDKVTYRVKAYRNVKGKKIFGAYGYSKQITVKRTIPAMTYVDSWITESDNCYIATIKIKTKKYLADTLYFVNKAGSIDKFKIASNVSTKDPVSDQKDTISVVEPDIMKLGTSLKNMEALYEGEKVQMKSNTTYYIQYKVKKDQKVYQTVTWAHFDLNGDPDKYVAMEGCECTTEEMFGEYVGNRDLAFSHAAYGIACGRGNTTYVGCLYNYGGKKAANVIEEYGWDEHYFNFGTWARDSIE